MVRRRPSVLVAALALAVALLAGCSTRPLTSSAAVEQVEDALDDVGLDAVAVELDPAAPPDSLAIVATVEGGELSLLVDPGSGRFRSIEIAPGTEVSEGQLEALARSSGNPVDDRARARRGVVGGALVVVVVAAGLALARRARLAEESASESVS